MARVDAYGEIGNNIGQHASVGGTRGNASAVWAHLNTDNGSQSDCALQVRAEVSGDRSEGGRPRKTCNCGHRWGSEWPAPDETCPQCQTPRQGRDTRETYFEIGLPETAGGWQARITTGNPGLRRLAEVGALLCGVKGLQAAASGDLRRGADIIAFARETLEECATAGSEYANVLLPGGVSLAHALGCVRIVQAIVGSESNGN